MESQKINRAHNGKKISIAHGAMSNVGRRFNVSRKTKDTVSRETLSNIGSKVRYTPSPNRVKPDYSGFDVASYRDAIVPGGKIGKRNEREKKQDRRKFVGPQKFGRHDVVAIPELPSLYNCDFDLTPMSVCSRCGKGSIEKLCTRCIEVDEEVRAYIARVAELRACIGPDRLDGPCDVPFDVQDFVEEYCIRCWSIKSNGCECRCTDDIEENDFGFRSGRLLSDFVLNCECCGNMCNGQRVHWYNGSTECYTLTMFGVYEPWGNVSSEDTKYPGSDYEDECGDGAVVYEAQGVEFEPQNAGPARVHWTHSDLPECGHVVDDKEIDLSVSEKFIAEQYLTFSDLSSGFPALAVANANFCELCGGVDICRHILKTVDCDEMCLDAALFLAIKSSHEHLGLATRPSLVSLASPHIRYVLAKIIDSRCCDIRVKFWLASVHRLCLDVYPHKIVPQSLFSDVYERVSSVIGAMWEILGRLPTHASNLFGDMLQWITRALRQCVAQGISGCVDAVVTAIKEKISDFVDDFWAKHKYVIITFVKTIVRIAMDYSPTMILLEYLWDPYMSGVGMISKWFDPGIVAQGEEDMGLVVTTLIVAVFVALGKTIPKMKLVSDTVSAMIGAAAVYNRSQLWNHFMALSKWVKGGDDLPMVLENMRDLFPDTVDMILCHMSIVETAAASKSTSQLRTTLGFYYAGYLRERINFGKHKEQLTHLAGPALRFISSSGINPIEAVRRRPSMFVFWGVSGLGKSHLISTIANMIAKKHEENYTSGGSFSAANAIYNVNTGDDYCSGYDNQDIWLFDEWFQEKDTEQNPSSSIKYAFTLVSTRPNKLNMAAVDDKGKTAFVSVILAATNVTLTDHHLKTFVKSIHDPNAICTRVNYRVRPILKEPFAMVGGKLCKHGRPFEEIAHPRDMFNFHVTTVGDKEVPGDLEDGLWSFRKLVNEVDKEYVACREFVPNENIVDLSDFDGPSEPADKVKAEGFFDWFTTPVVTQEMFYDLIVPPMLEEGGQPKGLFARCASTFELCSAGDVGAMAKWIKYRPNDKCVELDELITLDGAVEGELSSGFYLFRRVFVLPTRCYTFGDVAMGLAMMATAVAAAVIVARKIKKKVEETTEVAGVVIDGVSHWWNGDSGCYEPQSQLVVQDGVTYFKVHTKEGIKYYPQGERGDLLRLVDNQRTIQQVPVIIDSLFNIVRNERCVGNAFAITDQRLFMPAHVFDSVKHGSFTVSNGKVALALRAFDENCGYFIREVGVDGVVLCLRAFKLNGVRNNITKVCKSTPLGGLCRQYYRNVRGEIESYDATYTQAPNMVEYTFHDTYKFKSKDVRNTTAPGRTGVCGAIYINVNEANIDANGGVIIGYHVAANEAMDARLFATFDSIQWTLTTLVSTCLPELEGVKHGVGERFGFESGSVPVPTPTRFSGRIGETNVPMSDTDNPYVVSLLREMEFAGVEIDPLDAGLKRLYDVARSRPSMPNDFHVAADVVSARLVKHAIVMKPNWVTTFNGGPMLPSISRQAAVGPPLSNVGPTKDVLCLSAEELRLLGLQDSVLPSVDALEMLYELEDRIKSGYCFQNASALSLKEEARLRSKVLQGNTRLFAGAPGHEFLLQRKYFYGVLATFLRKNVAVHSALGLDPSQGKVLHDLLLNGRIRPSVFSGDYRGYDMCFSPEFFPYVSRIIRSIAAGKVVGDDIIDEDDYVRYVLLMRLAFNRMQLGKEIFEPKTGHPSGSALTTILNIVANILLFTYALSKMMKCSFDSVFDRVAMLFLGDDSHVVVDDGKAFDTAILVAAMAECGFVVTDCDKLEKPRWRDPYVSGSRSEYTFLGRHFTMGDSVLEFARVEKMLKFCEERRVLETQPQAILSYREEIARWVRTDQLDWCSRILPQLKHFGFASVDEFVGVSNSELVQRLLHAFLDDPAKMVVKVPAYNRKERDVVVPQGVVVYTPQGDSDGAPVVREQVTDAVIAGPSGDTESSTEMKGDYVNSHMDLENRAPPGVFSRFYVVEQGTLPTLVDDEFSEIAVPGSYFYNNPNAQMKLANAAFFRCTFCCKMILASTPFVTGKILMAFRPRTSATDVFEASADRCVEIDLSTGHSGVIKFPTILPTNWSLIERFTAPGGSDTYQPGFDYGWISCWTLAAPSESIPYSLVVWLEDVQIRGTTVTTFTITPQGKKDKKEEKRTVCDAAEVIRAKHEAEMEKARWQWKVENTPGWLNKTAASVETIGGCVETLEESVLGPLGDFMDKAGEGLGTAAGAALMGGCCAPLPDVHAKGFFTAPNWAQAHMITNVPAIKLAVVQNQKIVLPREIFGSRGDEMNIRSFASRMGLLGRATWSGTDLGGTTIASWDVIPGNVPVASGDTTYSCAPPPVAYVCTMFRLHRGALRYRLSIAKSIYNTGTLEIIYQMGLGTVVPSSAAREALCFRYVWDVTESSSVEIEIPYIAATAFTQIYFQRFGEKLGVTDVTTGRIYVNVINPLTSAGGVVPSAVTVLFFVAGGDDFEVALPGRHSQFIENVNPLPAPSLALHGPVLGTKSAGKKKEKWVPQGVFGTDETEDGLNSKEVFLVRPINRANIWDHMSTVGERVLSMRALIKRFGIHLPANASGIYTMYDVYQSSFFMNTIVRGFAFWTGSYRISFHVSEIDNVVFDGLVPLDWWLGWNDDGSFSALNIGAAHFTMDKMSNLNTMEIPWYDVLPFNYINKNARTELIGQPMEHSFYQAAAGDDFQFGWQTGIPAMTFSVAKPAPLY